MEWGDSCGEPVILADPPAGQGFAYAPSGAVYEQIRAVTFKLVDAVAGTTRVPIVSYLDGSGLAFAVAAPSFNLGSGQTSVFSFAVGIQPYGANAAAHIGGPLPPLWLDMRATFDVSVDGIQGADQISDVRLYVVSRPIVADGNAGE